MVINYTFNISSYFNSKSENLNLISKKNRNTNFGSIPNDLCSSSLINSNTQNAIIASKLSQVYQWGAGRLLPQPIEFFRKNNAPLSVALGPSHFAVITLERELFTWAVCILFILWRLSSIILSIENI